jgi:hypothetical protein
MYKAKIEPDVLTDIQVQRAAKKSLRQIAAAYGRPITHGDIGRILHGVFPKGEAKRAALRLPPVCPACTQRLPRQPRLLPDWLLEAMQNLAELEVKVKPSPEENRVYARGGERVRFWVRETFVRSKGASA